MCNNNSVSRKPWSVCDSCGEVIDSLGRCGCDYQRAPSQFNWNNRFIAAAAVAVILLAVSLLSTMPAKAQTPQPYPTPTTSVNEPPTMLHVVYLPVVLNSQDDEPSGQGRYWGGSAERPEVSWRPSRN